jgi:hypothetical protein
MNSERNVFPSRGGVEVLADLDRQLADLSHDRLQGGDEREHDLPAVAAARRSMRDRSRDPKVAIPTKLVMARR